MEYTEIIDTILKPFVVKQPYDIDGDYYMSSAATTRCVELRPRTKIYFWNKDSCLKMSEELNTAGFKNRVGYNSDGDFWSIFILE